MSSRFASLATAVCALAAAGALAAPLVGARAAPTTSPAAVQTATPAPSQPRPFTIAVVGDGFADALFAGLKLDYGGQAGVNVLNKTKSPYGLSQEGKFQWPATVGALLAGPVHVDLGVVMLGFDDTRPIHDGQTLVAPGTPRWTQIYGDRVEALVAAFRDKHVPVVWMGLPIVASADMAAKFVALNAIVRDRATKAGASYVDSWDAFGDMNGKYSQTGPDVNGRTTKLRMADGIDFTREGARKLASFIDPEVRRDLDQTKSAPSEPTAGLVPGQPEAPDNDINALIRREAGLPANEPATGASAPAAAVGPVVPLTGPALSDNGSLAEGARPALAEIGGTLAQKALVDGQPIPPQAGRMDDFSWPRTP